MYLLSNLTLGKKIALLTTMGLILSIGAFSFLGIRSVNQATEVMLQDRMTTARLVAGYLDEALIRAVTELNRTANSVGSGTSTMLEPQIQELETALQRLSISVHGIYLVDGNGQVNWSKTPALAGSNIRHYPSITQTLDNRTVTISSLVSAPGTQSPVIFLTAPLTGPGPDSRAIVVAIDLARSSIGGFIHPIRLGDTGYAEIVDQNGLVLARTQPGPALAPFEKSDHSGRFAALIAAGEPTRGLCHTCHEPVQKVERKDVLAFVPLSEARWGVIIRQSEEEALAPIRNLRQSLFTFGAGFALITMFIAIALTRDVIGRLKMLTHASRRIAGGDLTSPVSIAGRDEVGTLARTFEDMRRKLNGSYRELEQRTNELTSLLSVSEILTRPSDLSNLDASLANALDKIMEIVKMDASAIMLWDEKKKTLSRQVQRGAENGTELYPGHEDIVRGVALNGEAYYGDNPAEYPAAHPEQAGYMHGFASLPLRSQDKTIGVLNLTSYRARQFSAADRRLLEGVARELAAAIQSAKLHQKIKQKEEIRGELLEGMISIQEEERKRIARELHDETSQVLASLNANLEAAVAVSPEGEDRLKALLRKTQALSIGLLDDVHKLIYELRPSPLDDLGLVAATRWLVDQKLAPAGIEVSIKISGRRRRLLPQLETTLFRVIQEAVNNIAKHAQAKNANININFKKTTIIVQITDDGTGFNVEEAINSKARPRGLGLLGMKERIELIEGTLQVRSQRGIGTGVTIEAPLHKEATNE